jgi:hypothetical protein
MAARQRGAKALVVVTGPRSPNAGLTVPMTLDTALAGSGIAAVSVSGGVSSALFANGKPLADAQKDLDTGNPHVAGFELPASRCHSRRRSRASGAMGATSWPICRQRRR